MYDIYTEHFSQRVTVAAPRQPALFHQEGEAAAETRWAAGGSRGR